MALSHETGSGLLFFQPGQVVKFVHLPNQTHMSTVGGYVPQSSAGPRGVSSLNLLVPSYRGEKLSPSFKSNKPFHRSEKSQLES